MTHRVSTPVLVTILISVAALCGQDGQKDLDKLQGTWTVTAAEERGKPLPKEITEKMTVTFKGDKMVIDGPMAVAKGEEPAKPEFNVKLDPSKKPKALDVTPLSGKFKGKTALGIYQMEGDELMICLPNQKQKDRPTEFKSPEGSDLFLVTLKKAKK